MYYNYVALLFFSLVAIGVPALMLFASKLLRKESKENPTKNAPYESGEETTGKALDIDTEYFPFLMLFLPFEIIAVFALLVLPSISSYGNALGFEVIGLLAVAVVFAFLGYKLIGGKNVN